MAVCINVLGTPIGCEPARKLRGTEAGDTGGAPAPILVLPLSNFPPRNHDVLDRLGHSAALHRAEGLGRNTA
eukprot:15467788-Alexandrium_andersonii.AAC.1